MILKDYIAKLQELPQDLEVFAARGEWGPVPIEERQMPAIQPVYAFTPDGKPMSDEGPCWYEDNDPDLDEGADYTKKKVVLL